MKNPRKKRRKDIFGLSLVLMTSSVLSNVTFLKTVIAPFVIIYYTLKIRQLLQYVFL